MLRLYQSNRLENLSRQLAELLDAAKGAPLQKETVVVQHPGMARWLSLEIAKHTGICANIDFKLPATYIWETLDLFLPGRPEHNSYDPSLLSWRIFNLLGQLDEETVFKTVFYYLDKTDEKSRFQLAQRLADLFDRYLVYRPEWILQWEAGKGAVNGDAWQAELWRRLSATSKNHWVKLQQELFAYQGVRPSQLPQRLFLIGVPTLSPGYLQILHWLTQWLEVHLFLLNPCEGYWSDIVDLKQQARLELSANGSELYLDVGNPLLASMGRQGRDFFAAINELDPGSEPDFVDPGSEFLLARVQQQILMLETPGSDSVQPDTSISFHICHSPMRELEVLYDQLLAMLEQIPDLNATDILVMMPDIATYAPLIEAVFGVPGDRPAIPYRINDLGLAEVNPYIQAFLEILDLSDSRFSVNQLLGLLEIPTIAQRFGLDAEALEQVSAWVQSANIRWGRDATSKSHLGLPEESANTWQAGLEQLLLGYAMPMDSGQLWQGIAPLDAVEGTETSWLGGLLEYCAQVFKLAEQFSRSYTIPDWCSQLLNLTDHFFTSDVSAEQPLQQLRNAIQQLMTEADLAGYQGEVSLPLIRQRLEQIFDQISSQGFLGNGVNFCAFAPMRSMPFQIICLIGMNNAVFPREQPVLGFDLMSRHFRFGDRSRRADDRYLFLETLISARQRLYISYVGRDIKDNSSIPPSVVVDELRDYLGNQLNQGGLAAITHTHPLQPFSASYYSRDDELFSYSSDMRDAAQLAGQGNIESRPLISEPLKAISLQTQQLDLDQLIQFFVNPIRFFAQHRLNLQLISAQQLLEEREFFSLERFTANEIGQTLITSFLAGETIETIYAKLKAQGLLPHGNPGQGAYRRLLREARVLVERLSNLGWGDELSGMDVALSLKSVLLTGRLQGLYPQGQLAYNIDRFYPHKLLSLWIKHLVLNLSEPRTIPPETYWLEQGTTGRFLPVEEADGYLTQLIELYHEGLRTPLHFYPGSSWNYTETLLTRQDPDAAYKAAQTKWHGNHYYPGEQDKPYNRLLVPGDVILDEAFMHNSVMVFKPLIEHMELVK